MTILTSLTLALSAAIFAWPFQVVAQTAQYVTLNSPVTPGGTNYAVQSNQLVSLVGYDWANHPPVSGNLADGASIDILPNSVDSYYIGGADYFYVGTASQIPLIVTGVTNINVGSNALGSFAGWATFKIITPATTTVISNYVPADAVVIPSSATGSVQIILESSPDLINWTAANPGIYGAATATNRFFRVRAVASQ
jgi:hypothetical protein